MPLPRVALEVSGQADMEAAGVKEDSWEGLGRVPEKEVVDPGSELSTDDRVLFACDISLSKSEHKRLAHQICHPE